MNQIDQTTGDELAGNILWDIYPEITSAVGTDFFRLLIRLLAQSLDADIAYVAEIPLESDRALQTLALFSDSKEGANYSYLAEGTPCRQAIETGYVACAGSLQDDFPATTGLAPGINSCYILRLCDAQQEPIGVVALGWRSDDPEMEKAHYILSQLKGRASAELERTRTANALEGQLHFLQELLDAIPTPIFFKNRQLKYLGCNREFAKFLGVQREEIVGKTVADIAPEGFAGRYTEVDQQVLSSGHPQSYEGTMVHSDGSRREVVFNKAAFKAPDDRVSGIVGTMFDISKLKQAEEMIYRLAHFDPLTGLPNRPRFIERLEQTLSRQREPQPVAVLCLDLDRFKQINTILGHDACSQLLKIYSERLISRSRDRDIYARISGDRFAIALFPLAEEQDAAPVARRILSALAESVEVNGQEIHGTGSLGIALYPRDGEDAATLLNSAEAAMNRAKKQGGNCYQYHSKEINRGALERLAIEAGLRRSVVEGTFELHYQPQVDLQTGSLLGAEALLRWTHPKLGSISPAKFIPIAEECGLIGPIGEWVLKEACRQNRAWQEVGFAPIKIAVNLSGHQLLQPNFVERVATILKESGLDPKWLELELTESAMMDHCEQNIDLFFALKELGVALSVDDFGTGYSSLSYLKRFPLDKLKIDRSFVKDLPDTSHDAAITEAIIAMAHRLGLKVLAEGIETREQMDFLLANNCIKGQGYFFGAPAPAREFERFFDSGVPSAAWMINA